jgi:hypothetical protein
MTLQEQYDFFVENHYCIFPAVLTPAEVKSVNDAIDASLKEDAALWSIGVRSQSVNCLLNRPQFDILLRHKSFMPLAEKIYDNDVAMVEFSVMTRAGNQPVPNKPEGWHRDFGVSSIDPMGITALSAIWYLTDVDTTTARYSLLPKSQAWKEGPKAVAEGSQDVVGEVEILGPAGTVVLVNAANYHTGKIGPGPRERRTVHTYMQRTSYPSVSNHSIIPRRLWDVPDVSQRKFYSHFNPLTKAVAGDYAAKK